MYEQNYNITHVSYRGGHSLVLHLSTYTRLFTRLVVSPLREPYQAPFPAKQPGPIRGQLQLFVSFYSFTVSGCLVSQHLEQIKAPAESYI